MLERSQPHELLLEGPFESNYSLAIVNRWLARGFLELGVPPRLFQRDNTTSHLPSGSFLQENRDLAPLFLSCLPEAPFNVHSRYIYPPYADNYAGRLRVMHCYGWEESGFPSDYIDEFNRRLDLVTVMSAFVRDVLRKNGTRIPISVTGLGADHILQAEPMPVEDLQTGGFIFLHVSSCFPRKAADVLVAAFCQEFTNRDDVRLVIKTFDNPHNRIDDIVKEAVAAFPAHAPIEVVRRSYGLREMRWLYEQADCLVSASRGEGFGLPLAEAMFLGRPVIATVYSGQKDICSEATAWPVEYELAKARTHVTQDGSYWAEPSLPSLRSQMRSVYLASESEKKARTAAAREFVRSRFTWRQVAKRHWIACKEAAENKAERQRAIAVTARSRYKVGFVSPWNTRCGIAEYTRYLLGSLPDLCQPAVFASRSELLRPDEDNVFRCWEPDSGIEGAYPEHLVSTILQNRPDAVSIQFSFAFFSPSSLEWVIKELRRNGVTVAVTMHSTRHENLASFTPALSSADLCICHRRQDLENLSRLNLRSLELQPHGVPATPPGCGTKRADSGRSPGSPLISCFGFFLPPKGIHQLIQALDLVRNVLPLVRLNLLNALYPIPVSREYANRCQALIAERGLGARVAVRTDFLDDQTVLSELACSDLVVLPYLFSWGSCSGAIRLPIASMAPVLCSDLWIFDEFADCTHRYPAGDAVALANEILRLAGNPSERNKFRERQARVARDLSWPAVARQFSAMLVQRIVEKESLPRNASTAQN